LNRALTKFRNGFRKVRDRPAEGLSLTEVVKAKTVAFLLDGERLADDLRRAEAFASMRNMLRALADAGAIPTRTAPSEALAAFLRRAGRGRYAHPTI
jgi:hypothetical protein